MHAPPSSIAEQAIELADGLLRLIDVAFTHDLAVAFDDLGIHQDARSVVDSLGQLLMSVQQEVERVETLGELGALMGSFEPIVDALYELLLESARVFHPRATFAVLTTRRPVELSLAHLRVAARFGASAQIGLEQRSALSVVLDSVISNARSFGELLHVLDPIDAELDTSAATQSTKCP